MIKKLFDKLVNEAKSASSEEDLRLGTERHLRNLFDKWKINYTVKYEAGKKFGLIKGRIDSLWGNIIIEYKDPNSLRKSSILEHAKDQVVNKYIKKLAKHKEQFKNYRGVIFDGFKIYFCKWNENKENFEWTGEDLNISSLKFFLGILKISSRKASHLEYLIKDFGFESKLAFECISTFYNLLEKTKNIHVNLLFGEWKRLFGKIYGYDKLKFERITRKVKREIKSFKVKNDKDVERLFFSIHTYYAFVVKLIAAEVAISSVEDISESYIDKLSLVKDNKRLKSMLIEIENGGKFRQHGIHNFLEIDFFSWYLDLWNKKSIVKNIKSIIKKIKEYDPNTVKFEPSESKDLLKYLYQGIIPKCFRHDLGEYYTPDWLAEYITTKTTTRLKIGKRFLDPGCGSGTFLILFIKKLCNEFSKKYKLNSKNKTKLLDIILKSVVGIDLNPIAVITSRTNYLIAIADLLEHRDKDIIIPVYLADSIIIPHEVINVFGKSVYQVKSSLKIIFEIPKELVEKFLLEPIMERMELDITNEASFDEFKNWIKKKFPLLKKDTIQGLEELFNLITSLEKKDQDRIWCRILRNEFAPLFTGRFDYVIGNPPWISWESLPEYYKKEAETVFRRYGLIPYKGFKARLGFGRYDISMAFVYVGIDKYLKENGKLGFLITQSVFQSDPGKGFRKFNYDVKNKEKYFKIKEVYDLTSFQPFDDAATRTSFFFAEKNKKTEYPIPYYYWKEKKKIRSNELWGNAKSKLIQEKKIAKPIEEKDISSKWFIAKNEKEYKLFEKRIGQSYYRALTGAYTEGANGVYFMDLIKVIGDEFLIKNRIEGLKVEVPQFETKIESKFVYPLLTPRNIKKWNYDYHSSILFLPKSDKLLHNEDYLRSNFPKTYKYLSNFKKILLNRGSFKYKYKGKPFYLTYGSESMKSDYKVIWGRMGKKIETVVTTKIKDKFFKSKPPIPQETLIYIPTKSLEEAHYLCAILNSKFTLSIVEKYSTVGSKSFASTHILNYVKIPKFNPKNKTHNNLANLSKKAHKLTKQGKDKKLTQLEQKLEKEVKIVFV